MARRPLHIITAVLMAIVLVAAGCGSDTTPAGAPELSGGADNGTENGNDSKDRPPADPSDNPNDFILAAFANLDATVTEVTISIDASAAELAPAFADADEPADPAMLAFIAGAEFRIVGDDQNSAMTFILDGQAVGEMRVINDVSYFRIDMNGLVAMVNAMDPSASAEVQDLVQMAPMIAQSDPRLGFVGDLLQGRWVSMVVPEDAEYSELFESSSDPAALEAELLAAIEQVIDENTTVTAAGQARGGDRYIVEIDTASALTALTSNPLTAQALELGDLPSDPTTMIEEMVESGLKPVWELEVVITDGAVSSIRLDIADISTDAPPGATLPILITFAPASSAPTAPAEHTAISPELLEELFSDMLGPMMGGLIPAQA